MGTPTVKIKEKTKAEWLAKRQAAEDQFLKKKLRLWNGSYISVIDAGIMAFELALKLTGLRQRGLQNARDIQLKQITLGFDNLPAAFDGYRILQLSDLHIDTIPGLEQTIAAMVKDVPHDLCVWTGDYRMSTYGKYRQVIAPLQTIADASHAPDGILGILGNHDPGALAAPLAQTGVQLLVNESIAIERDGERIWFTGTDDPHYYFDPAQTSALKVSPEGFKVALVHSPELYEQAAENNYRLYLCGHTHAGQICWPRGKPVFTNMRAPAAYAAGKWQYGRMTGYTSSGTGVSGIPARFYSRGEITLVTLKQTA